MLRVLRMGLFIWLATVAIFGQSVRYFPQIANGASGSFEFRTSFLFVNTGEDSDVVYGNLHFGGPWPNNRASGAQTYKLPSGKFSDGFHVFALEWEEGEFRWYVDDIKFMTINDWKQCESTCNPGDPGAPFPAPCDERFHFIFNIAVGGDWPGRPDETTVFPQRMEVDYARVYQKAD